MKNTIKNLNMQVYAKPSHKINSLWRKLSNNINDLFVNIDLTDDTHILNYICVNLNTDFPRVHDTIRSYICYNIKFPNA